MNEPPRRVVLEKPGEKQDRTGCLAVGAILGIVVGIMVGMYALPPILKGIYGEKEVASGEAYEGDGRTIKVRSVGTQGAPESPASPGMHRYELFVRLDIRSNKTWDIELDDWTLEVEPLDDWQHAARAVSNGEPGHHIPLAKDVDLTLYFVIEVPLEQAPEFQLKALHLANPRLRFEVP